MGHSLRRLALVWGAVAVALAMLAAPASSKTRFRSRASPASPPRAPRPSTTRSARSRSDRTRPRTSSCSIPGPPRARLLRAAGQDHRRARRRSGRSGPWSVARTCSRTTRASTRPRRRRITVKQAFDYYLGYLADSSVTPHFEGIPDADVAFAKQWGMHTEIEDLARVVTAARRGGRNVVMGGHSLGGSITSAYATWDFNGRPGRRRPLGPGVHRRRQQPAPRLPPSRPTSRCRRFRGLAVADVRRLPRPARGAVQLDGLARRAPRPELALHRPGVRVPAGEPQAAGAGDQHRAVRVRPGHGDLAHEPGRGSGAPRAPRLERQPARLVACGRADPDPALRRHVLRVGAARAWTAPRGTTRSA